MKNLVITVDVDGVLRDNLWVLVDLYNKEFGTNLTVDDVTSFKVEDVFPGIKERFGVTAGEWFFQWHASEFFEKAPAFATVTEDFRRLQEYATVVIISHQKTYLNKEMTTYWLKHNNIEPDGICYLKDKTIVHSDYHIDDNDWNFIGGNATYGVLVTAPYNKNKNLSELICQSNCKDITRVNSFHEFVDMIEIKEKCFV